MRNSKSAYLFTYNTRWKLTSGFILNFYCFVYIFFLNNNNKYSYYKLVNAKFVFGILVYLLEHVEVSFYLNYKCGFYSPITLIHSGQTNKQTQSNKHTHNRVLII